MVENFNLEVTARCEKFKKEGLIFSKEDGKNEYSIEVFQVAFATFIKNGTQDDVQKFIAQIPNIKDKFHLLQNNGRGNLCANVLADIDDTDLKTSVMRALFDAGIDYTFLKGKDGTLFLYSKNSVASIVLDDYLLDKSKICVPYLKALLYSKDCNKFAEAVQDVHLGQLGLRGTDMYKLILPDFINAGVVAALEYIGDNLIVEAETLKSFYDNLADPKSVVGSYYRDIPHLANKNREELQKLDEIEKTGNQTYLEHLEFGIRTKSATMYKTLEIGIRTFKEEYQKISGLLSVAGNITNEVVKDKIATVELPIPEKSQNNLAKGYENATFSRESEAPGQEHGKLKITKFTEPLNYNIKVQVTKNKTKANKDTQANSKGIAKR